MSRFPIVTTVAMVALIGLSACGSDSRSIATRPATTARLATTVAATTSLAPTVTALAPTTTLTSPNFSDAIGQAYANNDCPFKDPLGIAADAVDAIGMTAPGSYAGPVAWKLPSSTPSTSEGVAVQCLFFQPGNVKPTLLAVSFEGTFDRVALLRSYVISKPTEQDGIFAPTEEYNGGLIVAFCDKFDVCAAYWFDATRSAGVGISLELRSGRAGTDKAVTALKAALPAMQRSMV